MKLTTEPSKIIQRRLQRKLKPINRSINNEVVDQFVQICIVNNITPDEFFDVIGQSKDDPIFPIVKEKFSNLR